MALMEHLFELHLNVLTLLPDSVTDSDTNLDTGLDTTQELSDKQKEVLAFCIIPRSNM